MSPLHHGLTKDCPTPLPSGACPGHPLPGETPDDQDVWARIAARLLSEHRLAGSTESSIYRLMDQRNALEEQRDALLAAAKVVEPLAHPGSCYGKCPGCDLRAAIALAEGNAPEGEVTP